MRRALAHATLVVITMAAPAGAQSGGARAQPRRPTPPRNAGPPLPGPERVRLVFNGGVQVAPGSFSQDFSVTKNAESMPVTTDLSQGPAGFIEGGVRVRVSRTLSVGAVAFVGSSSMDGTIAARVPHPFYFSQPRDVNGDLTGLSHLERGVHVELAYPLSVARSREITLFGGPSVVNVKQAVVTDVRYAEAYPFDTATYTGATTTDASGTAIGVNVGADATWRLSRSVRAGALVRYSFADVALSAGSGNEVTQRAGGLEVAAGLRILILKKARRAPSRPPPSPPRRR